MNLLTLRPQFLCNEDSHTSYEKMFISTRHLIGYTLGLLFLFEHKTFVWPICSQDLTTCPFLNFQKASFHFSIVGFNRKSLLCMFLIQHCRHLVWKNLLLKDMEDIEANTMTQPKEKFQKYFPQWKTHRSKYGECQVDYFD